MDDRGLIERVLAGDGGAFEELYSRYKDKVFRLCLRILWDREDALDATQDSFLKVYKALGKFRGRASFSTWLYRITYNTAIDMLRKRSRRPTEEEIDDERDVRLSGGFQSPERRLEQLEAKLLLDQALSKLPEMQRVTVVLHDLEGLKYREIAEILGCSIGTVMSRLHYARKKLQILLEEPKGGK